MNDTKNSLREVVDIVYATPENAHFDRKNGFLTLNIKLKNEEGVLEDKTFDRVYLHRAFPFDMPWQFISVCDGDAKELAIIEAVDSLPEDQQQMIRDELERKYYYPIIKKILSVSERFGFSSWKVETDDGERTFTVQDIYRSIHKITLNHVFVTDMDGNRYDIPDLEQLDARSYRKIELFL